MIKGKPTFVHICTAIGLGSQRANTGFVHGSTLGDDDVAHVKKTFGFNPTKFHIPDEEVAWNKLHCLRCGLPS